VAAHNLRTYAIKLGSILKNSPLEAVICKKIQSAIKAHIVPDRCVQTSKTRFPRGIISIGAAVYDQSPNAVAVSKQLFLDLVDRVHGPIATAGIRGSGLGQLFVP
jgi:hypothetical protein